jgi:hypothetical protein
MKRAILSFEGAVAGLIIVASVACSTAGVATGVRGSDALATMPDVPDALIQMRRAGCASDKCQVYSVSIFGDGTVAYDGRVKTWAWSVGTKAGSPPTNSTN